MKTEGLSPKTVGATLAALFTPLVVAFIAERLDTHLDVSLVQALLAAGITALVTAVVAFFSKPGTVVATSPGDSTGTRVVSDQRGYTVIELAVGVVVLLILIVLLFALVDRV